MLMKLITTVFLVLLLMIGGFLIYENIPHSPVQLSSELAELSEEPVYLSTTPVFEENLRFDHNEITYFIKDSCSPSRTASMTKAFNILEKEVKEISFKALKSDEADITVMCSDRFVPVGGNYYAAGEGGPSRIIKLGKYNIIEKGVIYLYKDSVCEYPNVELHELLHVFGFDHSDNPKNIMYNKSSCDQRISDDIIKILRDLYSIEPLPDAVITNLSAVKKGRYLDFNITVVNQGFKGFGNLSLVVVSDDKIIETFYLGELERGFARTLRTVNIKMPSSSVDVVDFYVDYENAVRELDETNNHVRMRTN
jgi:hypothetical protein